MTVKWPILLIAAAALAAAAVALALTSQQLLRLIAAPLAAVSSLVCLWLARRLPRLADASRNAFAALVHTGSAFSLALAAIAVTNSLSTGKRYWLRNTWSFRPRRWHKESDDTFYVAHPGDKLVTLELIWLSLAFSFWSAAIHVLRSTPALEGRLPKRAWKWIDYSVSAPTMLVVIGALFGVESCWLLLSAGALAFSLVMAGCCVEQPATDRPDGSPRSVTLALLLLIYAALWAPVVACFVQIAIDDGDDTTGTAPVFVPVFGFAMLALFTSFAVIFVWDFYSPQADRESLYYAASLISKTSLHLFIGLSVLGQAEVLGVANVTEAKSMSETSTLSYGLVGCALLCGSLVAISRRGFQAGRATTMASFALLDW